jgi:hypothetical protein
MKIYGFCLALPALLLAMPAASADGFHGLYLGARLGENSSRFTGSAVTFVSPATQVDLDAKLAPTAGLEIGYNSAWGNNIVGLDGFIDFNGSGNHSARINGVSSPLEANYGSTVYGADMKVGFATTAWMPYIKLGYGNGRGDGGLSGAGGGAHIGVGAEFRFAPSATLAWELSDHTADSNGGTLHNTNFTIGVNFYAQ